MEKKRIVFVGKANTGKSSLINLLLGQSKSIVSPIKGTTSDPIIKNYEIPGVATLVVTDTAGIDDESPIGVQRIQKTLFEINRADIGIVVFTNNEFGKCEEDLVRQLNKVVARVIIIHNMADVEPLKIELLNKLEQEYNCPVLDISAKYDSPDPIIECIASILKNVDELPLLDKIAAKGNFVLMVTPIDSSAPTGRLILPQVQTIRAALDIHATCMCCQLDELEHCLKTFPKPDLIITDSQAFGNVAQIVPNEIPLTSFSILLSRKKGNFKAYTDGVYHIDKLKDGDNVLILESCIHHTSCEDIGRVKIPNMLKKYTGKQLNFTIKAGNEIINDDASYSLVIQCGGCMMTSREITSRTSRFVIQGTPITNYGMAISYCLGIFDRAMKALL